MGAVAAMVDLVFRLLSKWRNNYATETTAVIEATEAI